MRKWVAACAFVAVLCGCQQEDEVVVPNRVLDRPLDVALACLKRENDQIRAASLNECDAEGGSSPSCSSLDAAQLIGFVANSERNEVAVFRRCDVNGLVDLDPDAPGYSFLPVGELPSGLTRTLDSCRVVSANYGSCDLSVIDVPAVGAFAFGLDPGISPSAAASTIVPRLSDGQPLGARPGDILAVPLGLSQSTSEDVGGDGGLETGTGGDDGGLGTDTDGGNPTVGVCDPSRPASVYVTFPSCQLVAEVSLLTQQILQSRQFTREDDGSFTVEDTGSDPECPVECPSQFAGDFPDHMVEADGLFPTALELIQQPGESAQDAAEEEIIYDVLFVGGTGSDLVFEMEIADRRWVPADQIRTLELEDAKGVHAIRATPAAELNLADADFHQFLYVIAGDGSSHVVRRDFSPLRVGVECDTQVDPTSVQNEACHEVVAGAPNAPDRRAFAIGPGVRAGGGAAITDWAFLKVTNVDPLEANVTPFGANGIVGIGMTSFGRMTLSVFDQYVDRRLPEQGCGSPGVLCDPLGIMDVSIRPHMGWPRIDPASGVPEALPRVDDAEPTRFNPDDLVGAQVLAPAVRRIDLAYAVPTDEDEEVVTADQERIALALGAGSEASGVRNIDGLGHFRAGDPDVTALYSVPVVRAVARDYRQWPLQQWALVWEDTIPGTASTTGQLQCESPGWPDPGDLPGGKGYLAGATCRNVEPDDARVFDESASFCDQGVLPGDKLTLIGCDNDSNCGLGQVCLREPTAPAFATGICVSRQAFEDDFELLRQICAPFILDPCGAAQREYAVTRAFDDEVWLAAIDRPRTSYLRLIEQPDGTTTLMEGEARFSCELPEGESQPDSGCEEDAECQGFGDEYMCIDELCRRPCQGGSAECLLSPLPGPACFAELVRYDIRARNQFLVRGGGVASFLSDRVSADPDTRECRIDPTISNLLTSRIRLGADEAETFDPARGGMEECPTQTPLPGDPNPCWISTLRSSNPNTLFHRFSYNQQPVAAVRFSNPVFSIVVDLTSLRELAGEVPELPGAVWPDSFREFRRSRIPRRREPTEAAFSEAFSTLTGYLPYNEPVVVANQVPVTFPVRVIPGPRKRDRRDDAPLAGIVYVVDAGGRGGLAGVRGTIARVVVADQVLADENFRVH